MTDGTDLFELSRSRSRLSPPVFPPGCYRAARRKARGRDVTGESVLETGVLPGNAVISPDDPIPHRPPHRDSAGVSEPEFEPDMRAPHDIAEALESLARELRRRGGDALRSSPGAPRLEAELRSFVSRFSTESAPGE